MSWYIWGVTSFDVPLLLDQSLICMKFSRYILFCKLLLSEPMEMERFELLTPCLQGRCSPNWATPPFKCSGSHLLSHIVSNIVPSAAWVLTIVFGMGTGVTPKRIATRNVISSFDRICNLSSFLRTLLIYLKSALLLFDRFKPSHASFLFRTIIQTSLMMFVSWTSRAQSLMTKQ